MGQMNRFEGTEYEIAILHRDTKELLGVLASFVLSFGTQEVKTQEGVPVSLEITEEDGQVWVNVSTDSIRGPIDPNSPVGKPRILGNTRRISLSKKRGSGEHSIEGNRVIHLRPKTR